MAKPIYETLTEQVGKSRDWGDSAHTVRQTAQKGDVPQQFSDHANVIEQEWNKLPKETQSALSGMPPEGQAAFYTLLDSMQTLSQKNKTEGEHVKQFITHCIQQTPTTTGSSR